MHSLLLTGTKKKKDKSQIINFKSPVAHLRNSLDVNFTKKAQEGSVMGMRKDPSLMQSTLQNIEILVTPQH